MEKQPLRAACPARQQWTKMLEPLTPSRSAHPHLHIVGSTGAEQNPHLPALSEHTETLLKPPFS